MKVLDTQCKICKKPMTVKVDDEYHDLGDPLKLIKMACHDWCYDLMHKRNRATNSIFAVCRFLVERKRTSEEITRAKQALLKSTRSLAEAIAEFYHSREILWSTDFADILTNSPHKAGQAINEYRRQCQDKFSTR